MAAVTQVNLRQGLAVLPIGKFDYNNAQNCIDAYLTEVAQPGDFVTITDTSRFVTSIPAKNNTAYRTVCRKSLTGEMPTGMIVTSRPDNTSTPPQRLEIGDCVTIYWGIHVSYQSLTFVSAPFISHQLLYLSATIPGRMDTAPSAGNETAIAYMPANGQLYVYAPGTGPKAELP